MSSSKTVLISLPPHCHGELYRLTFLTDSAEAEILKRSLRGMEDRVVGILRTDLKDMPIVVRQR
jgi:hypothetical protein